MELPQIDFSNLTVKDSNTTLFIIGNGFDLAHGVPSRYVNFRDNLRPLSRLRQMLETYVAKDELWSDFEDSLAYLNRGAIMDQIDFSLDMFVDDDGDIDEDDISAASIACAVEVAAAPIRIIQEDLQNEFRKWIDTLEVESNKKPFKKLIHGKGLYINFNYTEFLETVYNVPKENILYIHGNRNDKCSELILGHGHNSNELKEEWIENNRKKYEESKKMYNEFSSSYRAYFLENIREGQWRGQYHYNAVQLLDDQIDDYFKLSQKKTKTIIEINKPFFASLGEIKEIVCVGHSFASVDEDYFRIIKECIPSNKVYWYLSWHTESDLTRINAFVKKLALNTSNVKVFKI